jgi:hypothetical protein
VIRAADLRKDWVWVRPLIEKVRAKTKQEWLVEDIYAAVSTGRAAMCVLDEPEGVMVAYPEADAWSKEPYIHVWVCYCVSGMAQFQEDAMKVLRDYAAKFNAKKIVMHSPRTGWQKVGWRVKEYVYEQEVTHGQL